MWLPKRFKRRRRINADATSAATPLKVSFKYKLVDFKANYSCSDKFGTDWEFSNEIKINYVIKTIMEMISTPSSKAQQELRFHRHFLYLNSSTRKLKEYNDDFKLPLNIAPEFVFDLGNYARKQLCSLVIRERIVGDGSTSDFESQQLNVGRLQFKDSCIGDHTDLIKILKCQSENCCNDYSQKVIDFEAIIHYAMVEHSFKDYDSATKLFQFK